MSDHINYTELSDNELIERFRYSHDNKYVGELYLRYAHLVLGLCIKYYQDKEKAKDATMSIFENLITELKRHSITHFKSWLYTVSKNHCLQDLRKNQTIRKKEDAYEIFLKETVELSENEHLNTEKEKWLEKLEDSLKDLKENQQVCLRLFYLDGLSYADIVGKTNYTLNEVKSNIQNGKRNLKIKLEEKGVRK